MDVAAKDATDSAETVDVVDVTADADAATTDVASAITAACGSSFFSVAAAVSATAVDAATTDVATTAACGSSFFSAAVVDSVTDSATDAVMDADVEEADADDAVEMKDVKGEVIMEHVNFGYDENKVILYINI